MKFIVFFIVIPLVYSELHSFITTYTGIRGQNESQRIPEFSAVTTLDGQQIDNDTIKLIPKLWMEEFKGRWKNYNEIIEQVQQIYKLNISVLMERFKQTHGVHTYQRMYGCDYDDETGDSHEFDECGYDGEDFISLDLKELRYTAHVPQAKPTVMKWNNNKTQRQFLQQYLRYGCVYWLKKFRDFSKAAFEKADPPKVSLLQKNPENYVECHVTGFLFRNTVILWRKNGGDINSSIELVKSKETLPNEDRTFQRTLILYVLPDERKKSQYTCVVEHQSLTETIQKNLTEDEIESNKPASDIMYAPLPVIIVIVIAVLIGLCVHWNYRKVFKACNKRTLYVEPQSLPPGPTQVISTPFPGNKKTYKYVKYQSSTPSEEMSSPKTHP